MNRLTLRTALVVCAGALLVAALAGCSNSAPTGGQSGYGNQNDYGNQGGGMMGGTGSGGAATSAPGGGGSDNYSSVGERIWLTGVGADGNEIAHTAPRVSQGALMMGGGGCGSCHAANGRGGTITMMTGTAIKAPDVTYAVLIKAGFTDATIRKAITDGLDESGKPLKEAMPRWQMSSADLEATIAYLKVLGGN